MEAAPAESTIETSYTFTNPAQIEHFNIPIVDASSASSAKKRKVKTTNQDSQEKDTTPSVSKCYVFKSRLQEYCQKAGFTTPVYETIKEGPSHEPFFRSTVIVNDVRYDSLPGFFNRKAAEQSAAEVALTKIANSVDTKFGISQPVHETGLCKNLLQEYAQKMNYAIPSYECHKDGKDSRMHMYSCVVELGGMKYIGASASTKKEAEIKAARTALLAIQSAASSASEDNNINSFYTVIPEKKKVSTLGITSQDTKASPKLKKCNSKKQHKKRWTGRKGKFGKGTVHFEVGTVHLELNIDGQTCVEVGPNDAQIETNGGGSDIYNMDGQRGGLNVTDIDVSSQATDFGVVETKASVCDSRFCGEDGEILGFRLIDIVRDEGIYNNGCQ